MSSSSFPSSVASGSQSSISYDATISDKEAGDGESRRFPRALADEEGASTPAATGEAGASKRGSASARLRNEQKGHRRSYPWSERWWLAGTSSSDLMADHDDDPQADVLAQVCLQPSPRTVRRRNSVVILPGSLPEHLLPPKPRSSTPRAA